MNWEKSIFFVDVKHVQKNIYGKLLGTLLDIEGKKNGTLKGRRELMQIKIRKELHPIPKGDGNCEFLQLVTHGLLVRDILLLMC